MKNNFVEGNYEDKYKADNPVSRFLVKTFLDSFKSLLSMVGFCPSKMVEIGCGEGELLKIMVNFFPKTKVSACDLSLGEIQKAKKNCSELNVVFLTQNAEELSKFRDGEFDLTVCCEVLEHLKNPNKGLSEIKRISKKDVIVSVPIEPVWRVLNILRGKYLKSFGNTPGHLNHWSVFSFQKLIRESGFCIKRKIISFPWQMYLIEGSEAQEVQGRLSPFLKNLRCKVASMEIEGKGNILDVGCGNGDFKNWFVDCNYFGIDLKKRWLTNLPNLFVSDISKGVPKRLSDKKFDYIVALALIEHLKKPEKFLNDIKRRLASGGKIILTTPHPLGEKAYGFGVRIGMFSKEAAEEHENLLSKKDFIKFSKKCNLKMVKYKRFLFGLNQLVVYENGKNRNFR